MDHREKLRQIIGARSFREKGAFKLASGPNEQDLFQPEADDARSGRRPAYRRGVGQRPRSLAPITSADSRWGPCRWSARPPR